jgi:hypothetical protein
MECTWTVVADKNGSQRQRLWDCANTLWFQPFVPRWQASRPPFLEPRTTGNNKRGQQQLFISGETTGIILRWGCITSLTRYICCLPHVTSRPIRCSGTRRSLSDVEKYFSVHICSGSLMALSLADALQHCWMMNWKGFGWKRGHAVKTLC